MFLRKVKKVLSLLIKRPRGFWHYLLGLYSAVIKSPKAFGLPVHITIEPTNVCNLRCPVCETGAGILRRQKGSLRLDDFKKIIDKISSYTNSILFYYMGEPFLNSESYRMIRYARGKNIYVTTCTNGNCIDVKQLIDSGIDEVSFQIGGTSEETHNIYRVGSSLKEIIENVEKTVNLKENNGTHKPKIILGLVLMRQNESQVKDFYQLAKKLGVDEARIYEPCVRTFEQAKEFLPQEEKYWYYDKSALERGVLKPKRIPQNRCNWIYFSTVILCNGDVVPCCRDAQGDYIMGNILNEDFYSIWNGRKYREFRKSIKKRQEELDLCKLCSDFGIPTLYY